MKRLSEKEEALLKIVWDHKKTFAKDVREALPAPQPHINTVATTMRRMADKGFLKMEDFGNTLRYTAAISRKEYAKKFVRPMLAGLFGNSMKNVVAFFAEEEDITLKELKEIIKMISGKE